MTTSEVKLISVEEIIKARHRLRGVALETPLMRSTRLSALYNAEIYLKREDLQEVRSYKIRGSYNKMTSLSQEERERGVVCASAGNHAQGLAFACNAMQVKGVIFMPVVTPSQKVRKVRLFGGDFVEVVLIGDTYDDAYSESMRVAKERGLTYVHPFDDPKTIAGQGTVGLEILDATTLPIDMVVMPIGGGGLSAGIGSVFRQLSPKTELVGVEPSGAPAMFNSIRAGEVVTLDTIDSFVDGAAVRRVGDHNFPIVRDTISRIELVDEGKVCGVMLDLYNEDGLVVEPAGAMSIAVLDQLGDLSGKHIVCVVSGGNNDITRTPEIQERALMYAGLKHYFIVEFPQRSGALRDFLDVLGPKDDITHFEYTKKHNRAMGPALVGIQLGSRDDFNQLIARMDARKLRYEHLNDQPILFEMLI
ncbi:threonine dehydratase [Lewinella marina]|uniref:L-threonine dehydratase n=1 Tax=Neolewinella marina TaxID=438751 RepID=A0A2G0CFV3_9BACT|nr:threonine ammonia-lyase [Neolewinella marina]NJB85511.1 threonine dehydratase [Neolewinella marina]PHK98800.1 threonine dehydratase [Neolewinella marina]